MNRKKEVNTMDNNKKPHVPEQEEHGVQDEQIRELFRLLEQQKKLRHKRNVEMWTLQGLTILFQTIALVAVLIRVFNR